LRILLLPVALLSLLTAACGSQADIAENIPLKGQWSDETRIVSVRANGTAFDRNLLPEGYLPKESSMQACMEPYIRNEEEIRESLDSVLLDNCVFAGMKQFGPRVSNTAQCSLESGGNLPVRATLKYEAEEKVDKLTADVSIDIYLSSPRGATNKATIEMKREMIRIGDC
jgi:hypothetical protein